MLQTTSLINMTMNRMNDNGVFLSVVCDDVGPWDSNNLDNLDNLDNTDKVNVELFHLRLPTNHCLR